MDVKRSMVLAVALASVCLALVAGIPAAWLTDDLRVVGLAVLPVALVASLLVRYFDWRSRLRRRVWITAPSDRPVERSAS